MKNATTKKLLFLVFILTFPHTYGVTVGSDTACSRQAFATFPRDDVDNQIDGFALMEGGFRLEDQFTSCTFNSLFPASGTIDMSCGTLYLQKDLIFDSATQFESLGTIYGSGHTVRFGENVTTLSSESLYFPLNLADQVAPDPVSIYSADWSADDGFVSFGAGYELFLYQWDRPTQNLLECDGADMHSYVYAMKWHPTTNHLAIVQGPTGPAYELQVYELVDYALELTSSVNKATGYGFSLAWNPQGDELAVAWYGGPVEIYSWENETIEYTGHSLNFVNGHYAWLNILSFDQTGSYLAMGEYGASAKLSVLHYDGASLTYTVTIDTTASIVCGVDWSKTDSFISMGTSGASDQLRVYKYDSGQNTLTEIVKKTVGASVLSTHWNNDATKLAVGLASNVGTELRVYDFVGQERLEQIGEAEITTHLYGMKWCRDNAYIVAGDTAGGCSIYNAVSSWQSDDITLDNLSVHFTSDVLWKSPAYLSGNCVINGNGRRMTLGDGGSLVVQTGGQTTIKNIELAGLNGNNLSCADDKGTIIFKNCTLILDEDFDFEYGSIIFEQDVCVSGTKQFSYTSDQASIIQANSKLIIDRGTIFYYAPAAANRGRLVMVDGSSVLYLDGCTLKSTATGLRLTNGRVFLDNLVTFSCEGTVPSESICFGNGTETNDVDVTLLSGAQLRVYGGIAYENIN